MGGPGRRPRDGRRRGAPAPGLEQHERALAVRLAGRRRDGADLVPALRRRAGGGRARRRRVAFPARALGGAEPAAAIRLGHLRPRGPHAARRGRARRRGLGDDGGGRAAHLRDARPGRRLVGPGGAALVDRARCLRVLAVARRRRDRRVCCGASPRPACAARPWRRRAATSPRRVVAVRFPSRLPRTRTGRVTLPVRVQCSEACDAALSVAFPAELRRTGRGRLRPPGPSDRRGPVAHVPRADAGGDRAPVRARPDVRGACTCGSSRPTAPATSSAAAGPCACA